MPPEPPPDMGGPPLPGVFSFMGGGAPGGPFPMCCRSAAEPGTNLECDGEPLGLLLRPEARGGGFGGVLIRIVLLCTGRVTCGCDDTPDFGKAPLPPLVPPLLVPLLPCVDQGLSMGAPEEEPVLLFFILPTN